MYQVISFLDGEESILLDSRVDRYQLINPVLTLGLNKTGSLTFSVPRVHPNFNKVDMLRSIIKVFRVNKDKTGKWTKEWLYSGRPTTSEENFNRTGKIECEGILAYLIDSRVRPYDYAGTPYDYFNKLRTQHNSQVGIDKQFSEGNVDVFDVDSNNYIVRASSNYPTTLDEISNKVVKLLDVYLSARDVDGELFLDCITTLPTNSQKIQFGKNLLNLTRKKDSTSLYTAVIPLGAEEDSEESTNKRLTVQYYCPSEKPEDWGKSFRDYCTRSGTATSGYKYTFLTGDKPPMWKANTYYYGLDFVYDKSLRSKYGTIMTPVTWDDVTLQSNLFKKGKQSLVKSLITDSLTVKTADLSLTDDEIESFKLGWVEFISLPHELNEEMILSEMKIPLLEPQKTEFTIGKSLETLTSKVNGSTKNFDNKIQEIQTTTREAITNATNIITGTKGGFIIIDQDEETGYPWRILVMDAPNIADAKNVIQINKNGIGFSNDGINGPYKNAWTIDGQLVASFISTGRIAGKQGDNVYFDLDEGIISGSRLADPNSSVFAEIAQRVYDGDYYRGFILYDKKNASSNFVPTGGISRAWYSTETDVPAVTFYGNDDTYFQSHGNSGRNNCLSLFKINGAGRIYLERAIGENETPSETQEIVLAATEDFLQLQKIFDNKLTFGFTKFSTDGATLGFQTYVPTAQGGRQNSILIEPPPSTTSTEYSRIRFIVGDYVRCEVTQKGFTQGGVNLIEKINELETRISNLENK